MLQYGYRPQFPGDTAHPHGDDQTWIDYLPMPERPRIAWPEQCTHRGVDVPECAVLRAEFARPTHGSTPGRE